MNCTHCKKSVYNLFPIPLRYDFCYNCYDKLSYSMGKCDTCKQTSCGKYPLETYRRKCKNCHKHEKMEVKTSYHKEACKCCGNSTWNGMPIFPSRSGYCPNCIKFKPRRCGCCGNDVSKLQKGNCLNCVENYKRYSFYPCGIGNILRIPDELVYKILKYTWQEHPQCVYDFVRDVKKRWGKCNKCLGEFKIKFIQELAICDCDRLPLFGWFRKMSNNDYNSLKYIKNNYP